MKQMRILHRYLGYFLTGMMAVYAVTGFIMTFRDTDFLKFDKTWERTVDPNLPGSALGEAIEQRRLKVTREDSTTIYFDNGQYDKASGKATFTTKEWPAYIEKLTDLHTSRTADPLFFMNVFFACSLFFFVVSSFWMFPPQAKTFKKGMWFVGAGVILVVIMLISR